jgi:hypothetical protein
MGVSVQRARAELSKHVSAIRLTPSGEGAEASYVTEGEWDLLGADKARTGLVAGDRSERKLVGLPFRVLASDVAA